MKARLYRILVVLLLAGLASDKAAAWTLQHAPLMTDWAQLVNTNQPLPEYPRPQMVRNDWLNLNGLWQFQPGAADDSVPLNQTLSEQILVPFPMESALSGVMQHHARSWYRRTFNVPASWSGQRILLHFGAVDWESEVFINGHSVGIHKGGYDPFSYDITPWLNPDGPQELIVRVYDPTDALGVPRGKQTLYPGGIMYTATSGIWQTVWLEPVPATSIASFKLTPRIEQQRLIVHVNVTGPTNGITVHARARVGSDWVSSILGPVGAELSLPVPNPNLWSPTNPFLYDLDLSLLRSGTNVDLVASYFGMRRISMATNNGFVTMLLNNEFVFQFGPLDQGFWPDGLYTAPTDNALKSDIEQTKALGFNMIRKHIKVEPARWYYWADRLGMLVWQDMPSANSYTGNPQPLDKPQYETELTRMVAGLWNHPSIIMWVIFNESQGQHDTPELVAKVRAMDPFRLINQASGGSFFGVGDVLDWHSYPNPSCPVSATQAVACGEFGGVGLPITNHTWAPGWGYVAASNGEELAEMFEDFCFQLSSFVNDRGLSAAVYTEITDVEIELNGFLTYDRKVRKTDADRIRAAVAMASAPTTLTTVVPTSQTQAQTWKFTTSIPGSGWTSPGFNDSSWTSGPGGFGAGDPPNTEGSMRTTWNTSDIWLRRTFNPGSLTPQQISNLFLLIYHDEDVEVYINGVHAAGGEGYRTAYGLMSLTPAGRQAIMPNAVNTLAVHCHQTSGGQYIDVGLIIREGGVVLSPQPVPATPSGLHGAAGILGISLGWDSSPHAAGYQVKRSTVSGGPYTDVVLAAVNAGTDATVDPGTTYYYVVSATNAAGASPNSEEISITAMVPPPPELRVWLKADAITGTPNGAFIANWQDQSGNGFHAAQNSPSQRPTYVTGAMNGLPAIRFNNAWTNYLAFARPVENDFTIICVYRSQQGIGTGTQFYQGAGLVNGEVNNITSDYGISLNANGRVLAGTGDPDRTIASSPGRNDGQPHVLSFRRERSTGALSLYVDGLLEGEATGGKKSLVAPDRLVLGAQQTLINFFNGDIAEVKIFSAALSDADRKAEENLLLCKYGIGPGGVPSAPQTLAAEVHSGEVTLQWNSVLGAESYSVYWSTNSAGPYSVLAHGLSSPSYAHANPQFGANNYYRVTAVSPCGQSAPSPSYRVDLPLPELSASLTPDRLVLQWSASAENWQLWTTTNLADPTSWEKVTNTPIANGGYTLALPVGEGNAFFRLVNP